MSRKLLAWRAFATFAKIRRRGMGLRYCAKGMVVLGTAAALLSGGPIVMRGPSAVAAEPPIQSTRFDDWYYRCVDADTGDGKSVRQCEVAQIAQVKEGEKDANVLTLAIAKTAPATGKTSSGTGLLLTALVPLNVVLPVGLGLAADGKDVVNIPYRNCNQAGCWAQQALSEDMLGALQKGSSGEARLRLMNGQNINLRFSLKGLTKALAELQKPSRT